MKSKTILPLALAALLGACAQPVGSNANPNNPSPGNNPPPGDVTAPTSKGSWASASSIPIAGGIAEAASTTLNGKAYLTGGDNGNRKVFSYDAASNGWSNPLPDYPVGPRHHASMSGTGSSLYVSGGMAGWPDDPKAEFRTIDTANAAGGWRDLPNLPVARAAHASLIVTRNGKQYLYVIGGIGMVGGNAVDLASVDAYDLSAGQWLPQGSVPPMKVARDHLTAQYLNDRIYVIGGRAARAQKTWVANPDGSDGGLCCDLEGARTETEVLDVEANTWTTAAPLPDDARRSGLASAIVDGQIVIFGGEGKGLPSANVQGVMARTDIYDPASNTWRQGTSMTVARHGLASGAVGAKAFAIGGGDARGCGSNSDLSKSCGLQANEVFTLK